MQTDTFNHADRAGFLERLARLAGSTTWREPGQGGGVPYVARRIPTEHAMALALAMARTNPRDVGPDLAYSVATGVPHRRHIIIAWLAEKLEKGTGSVGQRCSPWLQRIAGRAYDKVIGSPVDEVPGWVAGKMSRDIELLSNVAEGWLWMSMEAAVERAEYAMHFDDTGLAKAS